MKDPGEKSVIDMNLAVGDQNSDQSNIYMICLHTSPIPNSFMKINRSLNNEDNNSVIAPSNAHVSKHHSKNSRSSMVLSPNKYNQGGNPFQAIVDKVNHSKTAAGPNSPGSKTLAWAKPVGDTKPLPPISPGRSTTDRRGSFALLPSRPASAGGKAPATSEMNKSSSAVQRPVSAFETKKQSKAKILSEYTTIDIGNFLDETEHTCNIKYIPLNPVSNICAKAMGPPIDLLRKKPTLLAQRKVEVSAPNTGPKRSTKYWICLSDLWLYFFTGYGDSMCKMMVDVKDANAFIDMNKHKTHVLHVHFPDTRKWAFEFEDPAKAVKFVFAIGESQRAYKYKNSIFMPPPRSRHTKPLGFTCPIR